MAPVAVWLAGVIISSSSSGIGGQTDYTMHKGDILIMLNTNVTANNWSNWNLGWWQSACSGALTKAAVWADDLVNSHILLGIDTTVRSQLVGLWQLSDALLEVLHLGIHRINGLQGEENDRKHGSILNKLGYKGFPFPDFHQILTFEHFYGGKKKIVPQWNPIKVLPGSSAVNDSWLTIKAS